MSETPTRNYPHIYSIVMEVEFHYQRDRDIAFEDLNKHFEVCEYTYEHTNELCYKFMADFNSRFRDTEEASLIFFKCIHNVFVTYLAFKYKIIKDGKVVEEYVCPQEQLDRVSRGDF